MFLDSSLAGVGVDWCIAKHLAQSDKELLILIVYTSYKCQDNLDNFMDKMAFIRLFLTNAQPPGSSL